jgi:hypothetical protein
MLNASHTKYQACTYWCMTAFVAVITTSNRPTLLETTTLCSLRYHFNHWRDVFIIKDHGGPAQCMCPTERSSLEYEREIAVGWGGEIAMNVTDDNPLIDCRINLDASRLTRKLKSIDARTSCNLWATLINGRLACLFLKPQSFLGSHTWGAQLMEQSIMSGINPKFVFQLVAPYSRAGFLFSAGMLHSAIWQLWVISTRTWGEPSSFSRCLLSLGFTIAPAVFWYDFGHGSGHGALMSSILARLGRIASYTACNPLSSGSIDIIGQDISRAEGLCEGAPSLDMVYVCATGLYHNHGRRLFEQN